MNVMSTGKKTIFYLLIFSLVLNLFPHTYFASEAPNNIVADSAVLMDALTGEILYQKNMHKAYPPASTTKVMTALLTLENCDLDEVVTINQSSVGVEGSKIWILLDEKIKVRDLLYALMISSANDVATALAEHIAGSVDEFAKMMNEKAKEIGANDTHFVNPHGLYNKNHKTSAYDLALIMKEAMKYPEFKNFSGSVSHKMPATNKADMRELWAHNKLLYRNDLPYAIEGAKTGYTTESLHSYVASAKMGNQRLIVALVHDEEKKFYENTIDLFNYGFENFELIKQYSKGDLVVSYKTAEGYNLPLLAGEDLYLVRKKGLTTSPDIATEAIDLKNQSYHVWDVVTYSQIKNNNESKKLPLLSGVDYTSNNKKTVATFDNKNSTSRNYTPFILNIFIILGLIFIVRFIQINYKKKKRF